MSCSDREKIEFLSLLNKSIDGVITYEEVQCFNEFLSIFPDLEELYLDCIKLRAVMHDQNILYEIDSSGMPVENNLWADLILEEENAPVFKIQDETHKENTTAIQVQQHVKSHNKFTNIINKVISIAAVLLIFFIIYANIFPPDLTVPVATVHDQIGLEWGRGSDVLNIRDRILTNQLPYQLEEGIIEVEYDKGVEVVIEGPAKFQFERAGIYLDYGRIYSKVSESGIGFRVDTPTCQFIDLGTEFGINAENDGSSEMHVVKGKVQMYAEGNTGFKTVREYNASRYNVKSGLVNEIPFNSENFVRYIDSEHNIVWRGEMSIDLADFIGGGNGFGSGKTGVWLNLKTGREGTDLIDNPQQQVKFSQEELAVMEKRSTDNNYTQVKHLPYIDGIFSPDGGMGYIQVSSQGDIWSDCPDTSGEYYEDIYNGSHIGTSYSHKLVLNGQSYGTKEYPAIALHSNSGITYDLDAIRANMPQIKIESFEAKCGISEEEKTLTSNADFFVLIDGKKQFQRLGMRSDSGSCQVSIPINENDRFLTLVVTDSNLWPNNDWGFFALPRLVIEE